MKTCPLALAEALTQGTTSAVIAYLEETPEGPAVRLRTSGGAALWLTAKLAAAVVDEARKAGLSDDSIEETIDDVAAEQVVDDPEAIEPDHPNWAGRWTTMFRTA